MHDLVPIAMFTSTGKLPNVEVFPHAANRISLRLFNNWIGCSVCECFGIIYAYRIECARIGAYCHVTVTGE